LKTRLIVFSLLSSILFGQWVGFTKSINPDFAVGSIAQSEVAIYEELVSLIDNSQTQIDICAYDIELQTVAEALISAQNRGVNIRVITDHDYLAEEGLISLQNAGVTIIDDAFGVLNSGSGEMHNKFVVIDASIVWTGSYNLTHYGTVSNANNALWIENTQLAAIYMDEFNEMWGSETMVPDENNARFHNQKTNNTAHDVVIDGYHYGVYFSPSDAPTQHIIDAISTANYEIYFSIFAFSTDEITDAMLAAQEANPDLEVKGLFESTYWNTSWSESIPMRGEGDRAWANPAEVYEDNVQADEGLKRLHHKVMIIDGQHPSSNPIIITGSMNWSANGESLNDENTLIIENPSIANQYVQEFAARFMEAGGVIEPLQINLLFDPPFIDFNTVFVGETSSRAVTVVNTSESPIEFEIPVISNNISGILTDGLPLSTLLPGDTLSFSVNFSPSYHGVCASALDVLGNDGSPISSSIDVLGRGVGNGDLAVVINEFMANPTQVADTNGEWIELMNQSAFPVRIDHWSLQDNDGEIFQILSDAVLVLESQAFFVLSVNGDAATNGGLDVDYEYSGLILANTSDEIILIDENSTTVDAVLYNSSWTIPTGKSLALDDVGGWNPSTTQYGYGDFGTPGALNEYQVEIDKQYIAKSYNLISAYPNPFNGTLRVDIASNISNEYVIYSLLGQEITRQNISNSSSFTWRPHNNIPSGVYWVVLLNKGQRVVSEKVLFLK
jgi:phosphatidylserine/phosphatidylglycerophosphate/cardiolipin synthase-like enzyme